MNYNKRHFAFFFNHFAQKNLEVLLKNGIIMLISVRHPEKHLFLLIFADF
jgi:hypothetical protein